MSQVHEALLRYEKNRGDTYRKRALILARRAHGRKCALRMLNARYAILKETNYSTQRHVQGLRARNRGLQVELEKLKEQHFESMTKHAKEIEECRDTTGRPVGADWVKCHKTELENLKLKEEIEALKKLVDQGDSKSICPTCRKRANLTKDIYPPIYVCPNNHAWRYSLEIRR